jgi:cytochrome P450
MRNLLRTPQRALDEPRMCVGFALATMELVLVTARLAQRTDLTPTGTDVPEPAGLIVSQPLGGAPMHVPRQ